MKKNNLTALIAVEKDRNALTIGLMSRMKLHGMATALLKVCPHNSRDNDNRLFPAYATCQGMGLPRMQPSNALYAERSSATRHVLNR